MKQKCCSFVGGMLFLLLFISGCSRDDGTKDLNPTPTIDIPDSNAYIITDNVGRDISPEFNANSYTYYFLPDEERPIYVYGTRSSSAYDQVFFNTTMSDDPICAFNKITNGPNYYKMGNSYTAPLLIKVSTNGGMYWVGLKGTGYTTKYADVNIAIVDKREYAIEYSHQTGYDIVSRGFLMRNKLEWAFQEGGTSVKPDRDGVPILSPYKNNLSADDITIISDDAIDQLRDYAYFYASGGVLDHDDHIALLYAVKDFKVFNNAGVPEPNFYPVNTVGLSWHYPPYNGIPGGHFSFVFVERVLSINNPSGIQQKDFDRIVIHELGHQRYLVLTNDHTVGHNGANKKTCVMFNPSDITDVNLITKYYNEAKFCESHKQQLYNLIW